jgi:hypothetical protein
MTDLVEVAQKVNSHASPPQELISGSLFTSLASSFPSRIHTQLGGLFLVYIPSYVLLKN